jgi:hypothetical protein
VIGTRLQPRRTVNRYHVKHLARIWAANRDEPKAPLLKASNTILAAMSGDGSAAPTVSKPDEHQVALELTSKP